MKYVIFFIIPFCFLITISCSFISNDEKKEELQLLWEYDYDNTNGFDPYTLPLIMDNQSIITSGDPWITSLKISDGSLNWRSSINYHNSLRSRAFAHQNDIIVGTISRKVIAWEKNTGDKVWSVTIPDSLSWNYGKSEIIPDESQFFIPSLSNYFYQVSSEGVLDMWQTDLTIESGLVADNVIYVSQRKVRNFAVVSAYDIESQELLWRYDQNEFGYDLRVPPILDEGKLYLFFLWSNRAIPGIVALNPENGEEIWKQSNLSASATIIKGDVIFGASSVFIWAVDKHTGKLLWRTRPLGSGSGSGSLDYLDGYIYAPFSNDLVILDAKTGEIVTLIESNLGSKYQFVKAAAGRIFLQSNQKLYAFAPWGHEEPID